MFSLFVITTKQKDSKQIMITEDKVTEFFCIADDFYKVFDTQMVKYAVMLINMNNKKGNFKQ